MATVLIIEDRAIDRKLLATILRTEGHEVIETSDGAEALRALNDRKPDLVISDILMPSVDGYEFVRRLRENAAFTTLPVIFYTATYHEREARALAEQCGVVDILLKPSAPATILTAVTSAMGSAPQRLALADRATFDREHVNVVNSTLMSRLSQFRADPEPLAG